MDFWGDYHHSKTLKIDLWGGHQHPRAMNFDFWGDVAQSGQCNGISGGLSLSHNGENWFLGSSGFPGQCNSVLGESLYSQDDAIGYFGDHHPPRTTQFNGGGGVSAFQDDAIGFFGNSAHPRQCNSIFVRFSLRPSTFHCLTRPLHDPNPQTHDSAAPKKPRRQITNSFPSGRRRKATPTTCFQKIPKPPQKMPLSAQGFIKFFFSAL